MFSKANGAVMYYNEPSQVEDQLRAIEEFEKDVEGELGILQKVGVFAASAVPEKILSGDLCCMHGRWLGWGVFRQFTCRSVSSLRSERRLHCSSREVNLRDGGQKSLEFGLTHLEIMDDRETEGRGIKVLV